MQTNQINSVLLIDHKADEYYYVIFFLCNVIYDKIEDFIIVYNRTNFDLTNF
jgi:hypothetical protein